MRDWLVVGFAYGVGAGICMAEAMVLWWRIDCARHLVLCVGNDCGGEEREL